MKINKKITMLETAYLIMLVVMLILPFFSVPEYSITENTLSELGAQAAPLAWLMNSTFIFLALGAIIAGWGYYKGFQLHRIFILIFCISLTLAALFNHAPINVQIGFDITEDAWHSYFTCMAVLSFIMLSLGTGITLEKPILRLTSILAGISAIVLSLLISEADHTAGIWDRLLFITSFGWMICIFKQGSTKTEATAEFES